MLPRDSADPGPGDHSGKTSFPSPRPDHTCCHCLTLQGLQHPAPGGAPSYLHPGRPPANQPNIGGPGAGNTSSAPSLKTNMYSPDLCFFQPILLGAARNTHNSTLRHTRRKNKNGTSENRDFSVILLGMEQTPLRGSRDSGL